jgi:outer membrane protein insertion porin family
MRWLIVLALALASQGARADDAADPPRPIAGFRVRGDSKLTPRTLGYLAHVAIGDRVRRADLPQLTAHLISSELFESAVVALEDAPDGGVYLVATLDDKMSWIVAPTIYVLPGKASFGVGYAENNLWGDNKKLLLYGQLGTAESLFFGTFLDPSVRGTRYTMRFDLYAYSRVNDEYANPVDDPTNTEVARSSRARYVGGGALVGYTLRWWLTSDLRLRGGYISYVDAESAGAPATPPEQDGLDLTIQSRTTLDRRGHRYGVTWGPYVQLLAETSLPGIGYPYQTAWLRAYYSWRFFEEHQLELRNVWNLGRRIPFNEELTLGGVIDLRGYALDRFRGDTRIVGRAEYSVPIGKWRIFAFRALGFFDSGYTSWNFRHSSTRNYLPEQRAGSWFRNDVGGGLRVYVKSVVLPLLGLDLAYGIEGRSPELYFEVGLTDF